MSWYRTAFRLPMLALVSLALVGCDGSPREDGPKPITAPTPEERYERIITILQQQVTGGALAGTGVISDFNAGPGVPIPDGRLRLEEELTPPAKEGDPYTAMICLSTQSTVTLVLPPTEEGKKEDDRAETKARIDDAKAGLEDVPGMESLVVPNTESLRRNLNKSPIHEIESDVSKSCFELVFREGRWELAKDIPLDEDELFTLAIEYALKMQ